jgi:hypothetical protein
MSRRAVIALLCACLSLSTAVNATDAPRQIFFSGHSLMDQPLPENVATIAASRGTPLQWKRQYLEGSSIRQRNAMPLPRADVPFDTLLVTEQHTLIGNLVWNDSVGQLRLLHDRFTAENPGSRTWFYEPWLGLDDRSDPGRWIAHERAASPMWQCLVSRVNASLAAEGRRDRIATLPAGAILATLVERATQGGGLPGLSGSTPRETVQRLFRDDVHLTPLGVYFMALVVYASTFDRTPQGAAVPDGVDADAARVLQAQAWILVQQARAQRRPLELASCRDELQSRFIALHSAYLRDTVLATQGPVRAHVQWLKWRAQWHWRLRRGANDHPLGEPRAAAADALPPPRP